MGNTITEYGNDKVEVVVTRTIVPGQLLKIHPSEAFLGIESGTITVDSIRKLNELEGGMRDMADDYIQAATDFLEDEELATERNRLQGTWVVYTYANSQETLALPVEEFVDHTIQY